MDLVATPVRTATEDAISGRVKVGRIGLSLGYRYSDVRAIRYNPIEAVGAAVNQVGDVLSTTLSYLGRIFTGRENGSLLNGPLGIAKRRPSGITTQATAGDAPAGLKAANLSFMLIQFAGHALSIRISSSI